MFPETSPIGCTYVRMHCGGRGEICSRSPFVAPYRFHPGDRGNIWSPSARGIFPTAPYNSPGDLANSLEEELEALIDAGVHAEAEAGGATDAEVDGKADDDEGAVGKRTAAARKGSHPPQRPKLPE